MSNKIIVLAILSILVVATALSGCVSGPKTVETPGGKLTVSEGSTGPEWCNAGTKMTITGQGQEGSFEIKGITNYKNKEVCEAEYKYDQGSMVQYFDEKGDYVVMVYKDKDGKVVQEINAQNPGVTK